MVVIRQAASLHIRHAPRCSPYVHLSVSYAPFLAVYPPFSVLTMANYSSRSRTRARTRAKNSLANIPVLRNTPEESDDDSYPLPERPLLTFLSGNNPSFMLIFSVSGTYER